MTRHVQATKVGTWWRITVTSVTDAGVYDTHTATGRRYGQVMRQLEVAR